MSAELKEEAAALGVPSWDWEARARPGEYQRRDRELRRWEVRDSGREKQEIGWGFWRGHGEQEAQRAAWELERRELGAALGAGQ
jgi:hypothetical protein